MDANAIYGGQSDLTGMNGGLPSLGTSLNGGSGGGSTGMNTQMILLQNFWQSQLSAIELGDLDFKTFQLPLARIKKVMKTDDDVKVQEKLFYLKSFVNFLMSR